MNKTLSEISVSCPWCNRGHTLADTTADIRVSCHCHKCGRYYKIDFKTMRVSKINPSPHKPVRVKDVGGFVGGHLKGGVRKNGNVIGRRIGIKVPLAFPCMTQKSAGF